MASFMRGGGLSPPPRSRSGRRSPSNLGSRLPSGEPGEQGRASSFHSLGPWQPWPPRRAPFLLPLPLSVRRLGVRAHALKAPQEDGKQRCWDDKVWEVTGRGYVCSAWDCESRGGTGVRWPSSQAAGCPSQLPPAPGGYPLPQLWTLSLRIPPPTPSLKYPASVRQVHGEQAVSTHCQEAGPGRDSAWLQLTCPSSGPCPSTSTFGALTPQDPLPAIMFLCSGFL